MWDRVRNYGSELDPLDKFLDWSASPQHNLGPFPLSSFPFFGCRSTRLEPLQMESVNLEPLLSSLLPCLPCPPSSPATNIQHVRVKHCQTQCDSEQLYDDFFALSRLSFIAEYSFLTHSCKVKWKVLQPDAACQQNPCKPCPARAGLPASTDARIADGEQTRASCSLIRLTRVRLASDFDFLCSICGVATRPMHRAQVIQLPQMRLTK